jgi:HRDC domain
MRSRYLVVYGSADNFYFHRPATDWHIMKNEVIKMVASQCPTSLEELQAMGGLGEQKFQEYGERLIKNIQNFVQTENLEHYLEEKRSAQASSKKRKADPPAQNSASAKVPRGASGGSSHEAVTDLSKDCKPKVDTDDEFPLDFDVDDVVLPDG